MGGTDPDVVGDCRRDFIAREMGGQALVAFLARFAPPMLRDDLLPLGHGIRQSSCRVGGLVGISQIQPQLIGIIDVAFTAMSKPLFHQLVESQLVFVPLLLETLNGLVLELQRHILFAQLLPLRRQLRLLALQSTGMLLLGVLQQPQKFGLGKELDISHADNIAASKNSASPFWSRRKKKHTFFPHAGPEGVLGRRGLTRSCHAASSAYGRA